MDRSKSVPNESQLVVQGQIINGTLTTKDPLLKTFLSALEQARDIAIRDKEIMQDKYEKILEKRNQELEDKQNEINQLKKTIEEQNKRIKNLENRINKLKNENKSLKDRVKNLEEDNKIIKQENKELKNMIINFDEANKSLKNKVQGLEDDNKFIKEDYEKIKNLYDLSQISEETLILGQLSFIFNTTMFKYVLGEDTDIDTYEAFKDEVECDVDADKKFKEFRKNYGYNSKIIQTISHLKKDRLIPAHPKMTSNGENITANYIKEISAKNLSKKDSTNVNKIIDILIKLGKNENNLLK
jgi:predicted RNase H-like nuclease (RuvC/YqgF family)